MQAQFIYDGLTIDHTPGSAVAAGQVVVQDNLVAIAKVPIAASVLGALAISGVFDVATSTNNTIMGWAIAAAGNTDATVRVVLVGVPSLTSNHYGPIQGSELTDPGDAGAIPVTGSGYLEIVSEGAETRTMAVPAGNVADQIMLAMKTDGGTVTLTVASAVNTTGNNTLTFAEEGDVVILTAVDLDGTMAWRITANDGVALSTV